VEYREPAPIADDSAPRRPKMAEELDYTKHLLEIEYTQVRSRLDAIDDIRFKLKGWAVTLSSAFLALGFNKNQWWVMLLSLLVASLLFLVEADYLLRQESLLDRSNRLEEVMEGIRRNGQCDEVESYSFGLKAISLQGLSSTHFPHMFGSRSRAGFTYLFIAIATLVSVFAVR
jgi:hypothetical protein